MRPPFPYFGGKITLGPAIAGLLPPHQHYVEPYGGSLAVLLAKPPSKMETVNDADEALMTFWRVLRSRPYDLERVCALTPHSRLEFEAAQRLDADDELELARQVWTTLTQSRSGRLTNSGWRNYIEPGGSSIGIPEYQDGYVDRMAAASRRLHHVSLEARPALEIIQRYGVSADVLLYVDPPYLGSVRGHGNAYRHEMRGAGDHERLAEALHACAAAVVLSGYASDLYDLELYRGWHRHTLLSGTGQGDGWGNRIEVLWSNRPLGQQLALFHLEAQAVTA